MTLRYGYRLLDVHWGKKTLQLLSGDFMSVVITDYYITVLIMSEKSIIMVTKVKLMNITVIIILYYYNYCLLQTFTFSFFLPLFQI